MSIRRVTRKSPKFVDLNRPEALVESNYIDIARVQGLAVVANRVVEEDLAKS